MNESHAYIKSNSGDTTTVEMVFHLWKKYFPEDYWWEPFELNKALVKLEEL